MPAAQRKQWEACAALLRYVHEELEPAVQGKSAQGGRLLLMSFYTRSATTFEAALRLCDDGFGDQAGMLTRSLFEDVLDAHWLWLNPDLAMERMRDHGRYSAVLTTEKSERHETMGPPAEVPALSEEERKRFKKLYRGGHGSWTGLTTHERVEAIEQCWKDERSRAHLRFFADIPSNLASELLHPTAWSIGRQVEFDESASGRQLNYRAGASDEFLPQALYACFWLFVQMVTLVMEEFELPGREEFETELFNDQFPLFVQLEPHQMRKVGRNDLCPCGSGRKFKRCHGR